MKKFFQLLFTSRKTASGKEFAKVKAYAENEVQLGEFLILRQDEDSNCSTFIKYTPAEGSDSTACIKKFVFTTDTEQEKVKKLLERLRGAINKKMLGDAGSDPMVSLFGEVVLTFWIQPNTGTILVPDIFDIPITNALISQYAVSEWLGIEIKVLPELLIFANEIKQKMQKQNSDDANGKESGSSSFPFS